IVKVPVHIAMDPNNTKLDDKGFSMFTIEDVGDRIAVKLATNPKITKPFTEVDNEHLVFSVNADDNIVTLWNTLHCTKYEMPVKLKLNGESESFELDVEHF